MSIRSLQELFIRELSDLYNAERQLSRALPRLVIAAHDARLAESLEIHITETAAHLERLDLMVEALDVRLSRAKCAAIEVLIDDLRDIIDVIEIGSLRDIALLTGIQKLMHHQLAAHQILIALARRLDYRDALPALLGNLEEKTAADKRFDRLANQGTRRGGPAHAA